MVPCRRNHLLIDLQRRVIRLDEASRRETRQIRHNPPRFLSPTKPFEYRPAASVVLRQSSNVSSWYVPGAKSEWETVYTGPSRNLSRRSLPSWQILLSRGTNRACSSAQTD